MTRKLLDTIIIFGHGFAFEITLAALSETLPDNINVIALETPELQSRDSFYGSVAPANAYDFHLSIGLTEPAVFFHTDTSFAYGTHYQNWANRLDWIQSYNLPLPIWQGVPFHHYLLHTKQSLQPFLVSAVCGDRGKFAHPPNDANNPLSRAEYGYQFKLASLNALLKKRSLPSNINRISGEIKRLYTNNNEITAIELTNGETIMGELYIDTSGPAARLMEAIGNPFQTERSLHAATSFHQDAFDDTSLRKLKGEDYGWKSITTLRDGYICQTVSHPTQKDDAETVHGKTGPGESFVIHTGRRPMGWTGNCVAVGHASYILEPLTPAPMMLLYRDIERLLNLIPHSSDMDFESTEFNRLRNDDIEHCEIFHRAFYETENWPNTPYWQDIMALKKSKKLNRKITQFTSRGFLTKYDLETIIKKSPAA